MLLLLLTACSHETVNAMLADGVTWPEVFIFAIGTLGAVAACLVGALFIHIILP